MRFWCGRNSTGYPFLLVTKSDVDKTKHLIGSPIHRAISSSGGISGVTSNARPSFFSKLHTERNLFHLTPHCYKWVSEQQYLFSGKVWNCYFHCITNTILFYDSKYCHFTNSFLLMALYFKSYDANISAFLNKQFMNLYFR
jgi:hypothetical protein